MLIDKKNLVAKDCTAGKKDARDTLMNVLVTNDSTVATNGKILIEIDNPKIALDHLPAATVDGITNQTENVLLKPETVDKLNKSIPKHKTLPVVNTAYIGHNGKDTQIEIVTNDLESKQVISQEIDPAQYPDYKRVFPQGEPVVEIKLNIEYLTKLVNCFHKLNKDNGLVRLSFYGNDKPLKLFSCIDGSRCATGLIMSVK